MVDCPIKQVGCLHIWLFYEEKFAGDCKSLPNGREGLTGSSWYVSPSKLPRSYLSRICVATNVERYCLLCALIFLSAIDAPGGFLFEWWSVFWDIFIARTNEKHSDIAASYIQVCTYALFVFCTNILFSWLNLAKTWFYTTNLPWLKENTT
jgi:hypothetical protein